MKINIYHLDKIMRLSDEKEGVTLVADLKNTFRINAYSSYTEADNIIKKWLDGNENVYLFFDDTNILFSFLMMYLPQKYIPIYAAGGLIHHSEKGYLFIYKRGYWDLPKGKIDKAEKMYDAAVRECEEETGISNLIVQKNLGVTFHIFNQNKKWMIKITQWYLMNTNDNKNPLPQAAEGIEKAEWVKVSDIKEKIFSKTYLSVKEVLAKEGISD